MDRKDVYKLIDGERDYQDKRWNVNTTDTSGMHDDPMSWIGYMEDYLLKAKHILSRNSKQMSYPQAMDIIRKVTAMGVASMEQINTPSRKYMEGK